MSLCLSPFLDALGTIQVTVLLTYRSRLWNACIMLQEAIRDRNSKISP